MGLAILCVALAPLLTAAAARQSTPSAALTPEEFLDEHERRLASHAYFSKVVLVRENAPAPLALYLHKPQVEAPDWRAKTLEAHLPWLVALEEQFRKTLAEPLALQRRPDIPVNVVCVLQSHGDWVNYSEAVKLTGLVGPAGYFERRSRWTVTFHSGGSVPLVQRRADILSEFTHALLHAHFRGDIGEIRNPWMVDGLGAYLTSGLGATPPSLAARAPTKTALVDIAGLVNDAKLRDIYLMPIAELVAAVDLQQAWTKVFGRAQGAKLAFDSRRMWSAWSGECELWMHYLFDAAGPQRRKSLMEYLGHALGGRAVGDTFAKAFSGVELKQLDREFFAWVLREHAKLTPGTPVDVAVVDQLFTKPAAPTAAAGVAPNAANAPNASAAFASLAPPRADFVAAHGVVLQLARRGELAAASAELDQLLERARGSAVERRLQRERERLSALIALRDAQFAALVASGAKLSWTVGDKKLVARVSQFENETVRFDENRLGITSLPMTQIASAEWLREMPKELSAGPHGWARHYLSLLESDERALRRLDKSDPRVVDLRDDFDTWCPGVLRLGEAALRLRGLASVGAPADAAAARACIDSIAQLRREFADLELVRGLDASLREAIAAAAPTCFSWDDLVRALPGRVEQLGDARVHWHLDFADAAHASVFEERSTILADYREALGETEGIGPSAAEVSNGALILSGSSTWRLALGFRGPITLRSHVRIGASDAGGIAGFLQLVGFKDEGTYVASNMVGSLLVFDAARQLTLKDWKNIGFLTGVKYALELRVDATHARGFVGEAQRSELPSHGLGDGDVLLLLHSPLRCEVDSFEIEGGLDESSARAFWTAHLLRAAGF